MSTETNKAVCRHMLDQLYNQHRPDHVPEFFSEDFVLHVGRPSRELPIGREGFKERVTMALAAFPDIQITVDDEIAEGDRVACRWTVTGTHQGEFMGIPPAGKVEATAVEAAPGSENLIVRSSAGDFRATNVVVATGTYQRPRIPAFSSRLAGDVEQIHSSRYRNPERLPPGAVLVVGSGQSGCQIAEELHEEGGRCTWRRGDPAGRRAAIGGPMQYGGWRARAFSTGRWISCLHRRIVSVLACTSRARTGDTR